MTMVRNMNSLNELLAAHGRDKLNTLTKYPSILTLHKLGEKGRLTDQLNITPPAEDLIATEKIDGTNARIILHCADWIIGSRENLLASKGDRFYDPAQGIVEGLKDKWNISSLAHAHWNNDPEAPDPPLTVIYGEFYGGKVTAGSRNYGIALTGFRVFDVAVFPDVERLLEMERSAISAWRETEDEQGIRYGQQFLDEDALAQFCDRFQLRRVPTYAFNTVGYSHETVLAALRAMGKTACALSTAALGQPEGLVLRNRDRSTIVKARIEDYERALKGKQR